MKTLIRLYDKYTEYTRKRNLNVGAILLLLVGLAAVFLLGRGAINWANKPSATRTPTHQPPIRTKAKPTNTPLPTITISPTDTPLPTYTPSATNTPLPTYTPLPTATPLPTHTPLPTATHTPLPTSTPLPTATPIFTDNPLPLGFNPGWCIKVFSNRGLKGIWSNAGDRFERDGSGYWYLSDGFLNIIAILEYENAFIEYTFLQCGVYLQ